MTSNSRMAFLGDPVGDGAGRVNVNAKDTARPVFENVGVQRAQHCFI